MRTRIAAVVVLAAVGVVMATTTTTATTPGNGGVVGLNPSPGPKGPPSPKGEGLTATKTTTSPAAQESLARAYAQLYRSLEELQVTPELRVGEFLSRGPDTRARVYEAVRRAVRVTSPQEYSDGVTAVQVELPMREVVRALTEACRAETVTAAHRNLGETGAPSPGPKGPPSPSRERGEATTATGVPGVVGLNPSPGPSGHPLPRERSETATTAAAARGAAKFQPGDFEKIVLYTDREGLWGFGAAKRTVTASLGAEAPAGWGDLGVFGRLKVRHEATENGYRQILERVRALRFSPTRTVGEFLESDQRIEGDMELYIRSHPAGGVRYLPERICEVDVSLSLSSLVVELKSLSNAYEVAAFPAAGFNEVSLNVAGATLEATGAAVPEPAARTEEAAPVVALWTRTAEAELPEVADDAQQGRLLASRAALAVAREEIREEIFALPLGGSTVGATVDEHPALRKDIDTFLVNLREVKVRNMKGNRVEVTAEIEPGRMREVLEFYRQKK